MTVFATRFSERSRTTITEMPIVLSNDYLDGVSCITMRDIRRPAGGTLLKRTGSGRHNPWRIELEHQLDCIPLIGRFGDEGGLVVAQPRLAMLSLIDLQEPHRRITPAGFGAELRLDLLHRGSSSSEAWTTYQRLLDTDPFFRSSAIRIGADGVVVCSIEFGEHNSRAALVSRRTSDLEADLVHCLPGGQATVCGDGVVICASGAGLKTLTAGGLHLYESEWEAMPGFPGHLFPVRSNSIHCLASQAVSDGISAYVLQLASTMPSAAFRECRDARLRDASCSWLVWDVSADGMHVSFLGTLRAASATRWHVGITTLWCSEPNRLTAFDGIDDLRVIGSVCVEGVRCATRSGPVECAEHTEQFVLATISPQDQRQYDLVVYGRADS